MNVICVEPKLTNLMRLKSQVKRLKPNATVYGFRSPDDALAVAKAEGCDLLLTEIDLGGGQYDGFLLGEEFKKLKPRTNIIFVTERMDNQRAGRALALHACGYVEKPCAPEALAREFQYLRYAVE